jgi:hypothetical protein
MDLPNYLGRAQALEMQHFWKTFFESEDYRDGLMARITKGKAAHMEILLHHMVYGKPKETLALQSGGDGTLILNIGGKQIVELHVDGDGMAKQIDVTEGETPLALAEVAGA